jgi:hypothetical protein
MKKTIYILLIGALGLLTACNKGEAPYILEPTEITLVVKEKKITASTAEVSIIPFDDRAYYYVECVPTDSMGYKPGSMDKDFMMLVMDSVYIAYLEWRHDHLVDGENYIAPFTSHCLKYGVQDLHLTLLSPNTSYTVFAFCVNPLTNQPMGELFYTRFTTDTLTNVSLTFQFSIENDMLYVMPSNDNTYYICDVIEEELFDEIYNGSASECLASIVDIYKQYNLIEYMLHKNAYHAEVGYLFDPDTRYIILAAAYDGAISNDITVAKVYVDPDGVPHLVKSN